MNSCMNSLKMFIFVAFGVSLHGWLANVFYLFIVTLGAHLFYLDNACTN